MKIKKCTVCGKEFESHSGIEVCSEKCFVERRRKWEKMSNDRRREERLNDPITYTCKNCGKQFDGMRQKYCSEECKKIARKNHVKENNRVHYENVKNRK